MGRKSATALCRCLMPLVPALLLAKGVTVRIVIQGADLTKPIEITDQRIQGFQVWSGPGVVTSDGEQTEGFIIDWSKGVVGQLPAGLRHYEVSFYACMDQESECRVKPPSLVYIVSFDVDPSSQQGFVYLPDPHDAAFRINGVMYHGHGFEGHWMRATAEWDAFARPLLEKAGSAALSR